MVCEAVNRLDKWNTYSIMTMPDHIHLLAAPLDREAEHCCFSKMVQALRLTESYGARGGKNGAGNRAALIAFFERLNQSTEKCELTIRENPVRAGLVHALETVAISKRVLPMTNRWDRRLNTDDPLQEPDSAEFIKKAAPEFSRSGAAGVIAPKLLWPWRWRFFWLFLVSTFRLPVSLAVIG